MRRHAACVLRSALGLAHTSAMLLLGPLLSTATSSSWRRSAASSSGIAMPTPTRPSSSSRGAWPSSSGRPRRARRRRDFRRPVGVEHRPVALECMIMLVEPRGTVNTGDAGGEFTARGAVVRQAGGRGGKLRDRRRDTGGGGPGGVGIRVVGDRGGGGGFGCCVAGHASPKLSRGMAARSTAGQGQSRRCAFGDRGDLSPRTGRSHEATPRQANLSVARTSASTFSASNAEWPEAGEITSSAFGQALCRSQAFCHRAHHVVAAVHDHARGCRRCGARRAAAGPRPRRSRH